MSVWQDIAIAIAQVTFTGSLIPAIRAGSILPLATTLSATFAVGIMLAALISLGFWLASAMTVIKLLLWARLAWQSYITRTPVPKR